MTKKVEYAWSEESQKAFEKLKEIMTTFPVLTIPYFSLPFIINYDASRIGIGVILMHKGHPITFESKKTKPHERNYNNYDKEMLAIIHVLSKLK